jgi:dsRNA-specific ribonuclease
MKKEKERMEQKTTEYYIGGRGQEFKCFLERLLHMSQVDEEYYQTLLDDEGLALFSQVFTHKSVDPVNNYEYYEFLGDVSVNKAIAWYLAKRFPQLQCPAGVKILTRLKINLISKRSFADFAKSLHFWNFVSADMHTRSTKMNKVLEDVFESFFAAVELLGDSKIRQGVGFFMCNNIISSLMDTREMSLKYDELFDAKTRLKEMFDYFGATKLGRLHYDTIRDPNTDMHITTVYVLRGRDKTQLGTKVAPLKADSEQYAAEQAIKSLKTMGFVKPLPDTYKNVCT